MRGAEAADVSSLAQVQLCSALAGFAHIFPQSIPKPTLADLEIEWGGLIAAADRSILVAEEAGEPVGVVVFGADNEPSFPTDSILLKLYVVPEHFGRGIGSRLYDQAVAGVRAAGFTRVRLWVLERNLPARRMYERRGWRLQPWVRSDWPGSGILEIGYALDLDYSM